ncbi:hypothetical protein A7J71_25030 [Achromobacter insolitus]|nr:hypothetical protein A7J71_25030 [Achromobacter insolitus]OCZ52541.1 hypothetical protein A7P22_26775 [Achromobacter insolitus]
MMQCFLPIMQIDLAYFTIGQCKTNRFARHQGYFFDERKVASYERAQVWQHLQHRTNQYDAQLNRLPILLKIQ